MQYNYNLEEIKNDIDEDKMFDFLNAIGAEPIQRNGIIVNRTICHHAIGEPCSHKLYYYPNTKLFKCYTDCGGDAFDLFQLVRKMKTIESGSEYPLPAAVDFVAKYFGYSKNAIEEEDASEIDEYLTNLKSYDRIKEIDVKTQKIELKTYDGNFLTHLPHPKLPWEQEGITKEVSDAHNICYDPVKGGIVIPHYDINNNLIGIRIRELSDESIERFGKYHPAMFKGKLYNHPLSFALYNLNNSKDNIKRTKKAIVFESEKATLQYASMFSMENDISVGCCGSSLIAYQVQLLIDCGAEEIIVGLDHDFTDINSDVAKRIIKNYKNIDNKYGNYVKITFLWDKDNLTGYKASPIETDKATFLKLFKERRNLY